MMLFHKIYLIVIAALVMPMTASADDLDRYGNSPYKNWADKQQVMEAAKHRFKCWPGGYCSCCFESEIVRTKFRVNNVNGADEWWWYDPKREEWRYVKPDIIHPADEDTPTGQPVIFVLNSGEPSCFFAPKGGL